ncbi:MAG: plasmid mobilization protein [Varibaculum cambriense]
MKEMRYRNKQIKFYVTEAEREKLLRTAQKAGLGVGELARDVLTNSRNQHITVFNTAPMNRVLYELHRVGVNLNQLVKGLNMFGYESCDAAEVEQISEECLTVLRQVSGALMSFVGEAEKHGITIGFVPFDDDE